MLILKRLVQERTAKNMELASSLRDQENGDYRRAVYSVAHDLNTPLGAIKSGTDDIGYTRYNHVIKKILPHCSSGEIQYAFNRTMNNSFGVICRWCSNERTKLFLDMLLELKFGVLTGVGK